MNFFQTEQLSNDYKKEIFQIWNKEYPEKLAFQGVENFEEYLSKLENPNHYIIQNSRNKIIGWAVDFNRDNEKWFAIIVDQNEQHKGLGKKLLLELQKHNIELNGWVIDHDKDLKRNGEKYLSPLGFYLNHNFETLPDIRLENEILSAVKIKWKKPKN